MMGVKVKLDGGRLNKVKYLQLLLMTIHFHNYITNIKLSDSSYNIIHCIISTV